MKSLLILVPSLAFLGVFGLCSALGQQMVVVSKTVEAPVIDGEGSDPCWAGVTPVVTHDPVADIDITLQAVRTDEELFFLVTFSDPDESRSHKSWLWQDGRDIYGVGKDREDVFVFKWSMELAPVDLSLAADLPYSADLWLWKACRTDPAGYADDLMQILKIQKTANAVPLRSRSGKGTFLLCKEDTGGAAFASRLQGTYEGDEIPRFTSQQPSGSRADVRAKGLWAAGRWTLEFGRDLDTGNSDDVRFDLTKRYQFGVSRYEITGRPANPDLSQPLYDAGEISENLTLVFEDRQ